RYRGMDVHWWLDQTGRQSRTIDTVSDPVAARREPSFQLAGRESCDVRGADIDLNTLQAAGVEVAGRLQTSDGHRVGFAGDLPATVREADVRLGRFLDLVDRHVESSNLTAEVDPADRPAPLRVGDPRDRMDLRAEGIGTVLLATGYSPHHPWLRVPVTGPDGHIRQVRGATPSRGLYVVGQRFQHRRDSATVDGAQHDAHDVVSHLCRGDSPALCGVELR
ncbi:MAG: hypothetical protein ABWX84_14895, partial [Nocardioides sp.]